MAAVYAPEKPAARKWQFFREISLKKKPFCAAGI
jgi:hypothetical protein